MLAEIASQIGASWTMAIRLPVGTVVETLPDDTPPQQLRIPVAKINPYIFARLQLNIPSQGSPSIAIRLTSGMGAGLRVPDGSMLEHRNRDPNL